MLWGNGLYDGPKPSPEESYRVCVRVRVCVCVRARVCVCHCDQLQQ